MSKRKITDSVNWKKLREKAGLTLGQLAEVTGYSVATINGLEIHDTGSQRLKDKLASTLIAHGEEGVAAEVKHWRDRAMFAEQKLEAVKAGLAAVLKKI